MVSAVDASKNRWEKDFVVLYDDGEFSAIWGTYDGIKHLGLRWNGYGSSRGFPLLRNGNEGWLVVPDFLVHAILHRLIDQPLANVDATIQALKEQSPK